MKIIITQSFKKQLDKIWYSDDRVIQEIRKYPKWLSYINMWEWWWFHVYKDYLDSKKKRLLTLVKKGKFYFPVAIVKKESKKWKNIHIKTLESDFEKNFYEILEDFEKERIYKIIEL